MLETSKRASLWDWKYLLIWLWATIVLSADIKSSVHSQFHWFTSFILLMPVFVAALFEKNRFSAAFLFAPILFISAVLLSGFASESPSYSLIQAGKLFLILLWACTFFLSAPHYAVTSFYAFVAAPVLNLGLIALGFLSFSQFAALMAINRWGTLLNYPGSLSKTGIIAFVYALYCALMIRPISIKHILLTIVCIAVVWFDGSRTAILILIMGVLFTIGMIFFETKSTNVIGVCLVVLGVAIFMILIRISTMGIGQSENLLSDFQSNRFFTFLINIMDVGIMKGVGESDPVRYQMILDGINAITSHPFFGTGIGSTRTLTDIGLMVIHNTYLQIWADLGIVGFLSFLVILFGWVIHLPKVLHNIHKLQNSEQRAIYYCAVFLLIYFPITSLFHPLSTEWSEWILYMIPLALYNQIRWKSEYFEIGVEQNGEKRIFCSYFDI